MKKIRVTKDGPFSGPFGELAVVSYSDRLYLGYVPNVQADTTIAEYNAMANRTETFVSVVDGTLIRVPLGDLDYEPISLQQTLEEAGLEAVLGEEVAEAVVSWRILDSAPRNTKDLMSDLWMVLRSEKLIMSFLKNKGVTERGKVYSKLADFFCELAAEKAKLYK